MTSDGPHRSDREDAHQIAKSTARLYDGIVDWYVEGFFDDLRDGEWLERWLSRCEQGAFLADVGASPSNHPKYIARAAPGGVSSDISIEMVKASARLTP